MEKIPCTQNFKLPETIGNPVKIRQWVIEKLPNDSLSIDNAIMLEYSSRWPLMIDPQLQGNKWIRNKIGEELKVLRLSQSDYGRYEFRSIIYYLSNYIRIVILLLA